MTSRRPTHRPDLLALSDENLRQGFVQLARHPPRGVPLEPRRFGAAEAFPNRRGLAFLNPVTILAPARVDDIVDAVTWLRSLEMAVTLRVRIDVDDQRVTDAAVRLGLEREPWEERAMALWPLPDGPGTTPHGLRIDQATPETLEVWYGALTAGFGIHGGDTFARDLVPASFAADPDVRLYGGIFEGRPVASSMAIRSHHAVGVYSVGTAESARGRGIGTALTRAAVDAGHAWGSTAAVLQASEMGEPVYLAIGFVEVTRYVTYAEAP